MKTNFSKEEIKKIKDIITRYQKVSGELSCFQKQADEIREKVLTLESELEKIKNTENELMSKLHKTYGDFGLQDIYNAITYDK